MKLLLSSVGRDRVAALFGLAVLCVLLTVAEKSDEFVAGTLITCCWDVYFRRSGVGMAAKTSAGVTCGGGVRVSWRSFVGIGCENSLFLVLLLKLLAAIYLFFFFVLTLPSPTSGLSTGNYAKRKIRCD